MRSLFLATNNKGKTVEIEALLACLNLTLCTPQSTGIHLEIPEDGPTYAENASKKALAFAKVSGMIALGDDSGLEVDSLNGQPGLHSHRFCSLPNATDADRREFLLKQLVDKPQPWTARFRATVAIATPSGNVYLSTGECEGVIIPIERGTNGFGYDPIFLFPDLQRTMAELELEEKNRISHRARAILNAFPTLKMIFNK